jgi:hypothetical protein
MGLCAPSEFSELQAAGSPPRPRGPGWAAPAPPMRSYAPTASPRTKQQPVWPGLPHPVACALRFSQPPDAFVRPVPGGPVSCRIRSWGSALQSFAPPAQPYAVSSATTLLALNGSETISTPGRPRSTRRAARNGTVAPPRWNARGPFAGGSPHRRNGAANRPVTSLPQRPKPPRDPLGRGTRRRRKTEADHRKRAQRDGPGALPPSGFCSTRESATRPPVV